MGELVIRRPNDYGGRYRELKVLVDGREVAALKPNCEARIGVDDGEHVVVGKMDWARSRDLRIEVADHGATVELSLPFSSLFDVFFQPRRAVRARVVAQPS